MPGAFERKPRRGQMPTADDLAKVYELVEQYGPEHIPPSARDVYVQAVGGVQLSTPMAPTGFWARITGAPVGRTHPWQQVLQNSDGTFSLDPGGRIGTTTSIPAYEINQSTDTFTNKIVWMELHPSQQFYFFDSGGPYISGVALLPLTVREVDLVPSIGSVVIVSFDQADGFVVANPSTGEAKVNFNAATFSQRGIVSLADQVMGTGNKSFPLDVRWQYGGGVPNTRYGQLTLVDAPDGAAKKVIRIDLRESDGTLRASMHLTWNTGEETALRLRSHSSGDNGPQFEIQNNAGTVFVGQTVTQIGLVFTGGILTSGTASVTESSLSTSDLTTANVTSTKHGFAPKSPGDATQFLNGAVTPAFANVKDSDLSTSDVTTNNVTSTKHGFAPKSPADATQFLNGALTPAFAAVKDSDLSTSDITTNNVVSTKHGFAPKSPADATQFLNGATTPAYAAVKDSDLSTSDITTNNSSSTKHGFLPKLSNVATQYLDGTGTFSVPTGSSTVGAATQNVMAASIFQ